MHLKVKNFSYKISKKHLNYIKFSTFDRESQEIPLT
jgi:hypothetical protein